MSSVIEKNDVNVSPLFSWSKEFEIVGGGEPVKVYMRVVGDADINKARVSALRRSGELRRKLRDLNSDERIVYIKDIDDIEPEAMISVITVFSMKELAEKAKSEVKVKVPKAPRSDAKTELHEKYQLEVDAFPGKVQQEVRKILEGKIEALKNELSSKDKSFLYKKYEASMIDELCERELMEAFREWTSYLSVYKDEDLRVRFFSSFDEFANLPSEIKDQFIREYTLLELSMDDLKKLQPVTQ
jgi:hypothetical protein